jgi:hypothetical protein
MGKHHSVTCYVLVCLIRLPGLFYVLCPLVFPGLIVLVIFREGKTYELV